MSRPVLLQRSSNRQNGQEPITILQAKNFLKLDHLEDDALLGNLITAARQAAEKYLRQLLVSYRWQLTYQEYVPTKLPLPYGPATDIETIGLMSIDGRLTMMPSRHYYLNSLNNDLHLHYALISHKIVISYLAGYKLATEIPELVIQGMLAHISYLYEHRGSGYAFPKSILSFYHQYRNLEL